MAGWGIRIGEGSDGAPPDHGRADDDVRQVGDGSAPVGLGALCDLSADRRNPPSLDQQSFDVREFVLLASGRRVVLHSERGFTVGMRGAAVRDGMTAEHVVRSVLNTVLPDDDADPEQHPWEWLAGLARAKGVDVNVAELKALPYEVILSDRLRTWLPQP